MEKRLDTKEYWKSLVNMSLSRLLILRSLHRQPSHGYVVLQEVEEFTSGCCVPTYGTIYPVLKELENGGYCTSSYEIVGKRKRKVYTLTERGEKAYQMAMKAWEETLPYLNKITNED